MEKKNLGKWLVWLFIFFFSVAGKGNEAPEYKFGHLTANDGLPQNTIDCMLKDKRGFMWFGTWNGLCRYDGYSFKTYQRETHADGLSDNFIRTLSEDHEGNIWVGTGKGLSRFLFSEDQFSTPENVTAVFGSHPVNFLVFDEYEQLWVATEGYGVWVIQSGPKNTGARKIADNRLGDQHINYICLYDQWAFVGGDAGLTVFDRESLKPVPLFGKLVGAVANLPVNCVFADSQNHVWVGTEAGLYAYDPESDQVFSYNSPPGTPAALSHLTVNALAEDREGNLIVGTLGGLSYFDRKNKTFSGNTSPGSANLNNPFVNSLLTDEQGNVWIGTDKGGVNFYNIYQKPFFALVHNPGSRNSISHNTVNSVLKEKDVLWIGTAGGGLNRISLPDRRIDRLVLDPLGQGSSGSNFISALFRSSRNQFWAGTWGGGLGRLKPMTNYSFQLFRHDETDTTSICSDFISSITELDNQRLLVGTLGGLDVFHASEARFQHVHQKMRLKDAMEAGCILVDRQKMVWVGTRNGLYRLNAAQLDQLDEIETLRYDVFLNHPDDSFSVAGNYVISLHESKDGSLWIGTYGNGICRYLGDVEGKARFVSYHEHDGLCNNVAYAIEEDLQGNLWISTDKGLSRFQPETETFQNFYVRDGLLSDQFYWSASDTDEQGNIYFGGIAGLNYFNAGEIKLSQGVNKPVFTEFSIFNNPVEIGEKYHSRVIMQKSISEIQELQLSWKDAVFSIEFSALDYFLPEKVMYRYQLEGVDQDWVEVPATRRFANYTNLSGGEYIFRVMASNSDGLWPDEAAELKIIVHPPFWATIWFRLVFVFVILSAVIAYIHFRTSYLKKQKRRLEEQVRERTAKIEEQKEKLLKQSVSLQQSNRQLAVRQKLIEGQKTELELQNEQIARQRDELIELNEKVKLVNQLRLRFFTNISHEFRTPLTLIIDPLEQLMKNNKGDRSTLNTLKIVNRNALRLLHLINQLIYFRRIEAGKIIIRAGRGDFIHFLGQIFESFSDLAQHQQVKYAFSPETPPADAWFDGEKLEDIFYNLLSNAFKNTPKGGRITMKVSFRSGEQETSPRVCVEITDNGRGISEDQLPYIFERFYQAESGTPDRAESSGIGLALTLELVQALHGTIEVESEKEKGSCFRVLLPYTREAFGEKELDYTGPPAEVNLESRLEELTQSLGSNEPVDDDPEEIISPQKSKPLILLVEDSFDLRTFMMKTLRTGYRVLGAENGNEGFLMAKKYSPDLIISDVMMPVMDGLELCSRLKKELHTSHIPVILLTAKDRIEDWIEGLEIGADDYIPKPFNLEVLQARIANMIENRRKLKKMFSSPAISSLSGLTSSSVDEEFLGRAYRILEDNFNRDGFSANQLAAEMFVSHSLLYKKIKAITDLNITDFLNSFRLRKAVVLMQQKDLSISDIAFHTGFNDPKYFSRIFRKFYGMSPSDYMDRESERRTEHRLQQGSL